MYKDDAASGQIFDATYRLERRLGGDQLANLYVATHMRFDHRVVLKILDRKASEIPDAVERFSAEVLALWRLNHANVVKVYAHALPTMGASSSSWSTSRGKTFANYSPGKDACPKCGCAAFCRNSSLASSTRTDTTSSTGT